MLLNSVQMAQLFGVTRVTYYGWADGKSIRSANQEIIRAVLRKLLTVVNTYSWPTAEATKASGKKRFEMLLELLAQQQQEVNRGE